MDGTSYPDETIQIGHHFATSPADNAPKTFLYSTRLAQFPEWPNYSAYIGSPQYTLKMTPSDCPVDGTWVHTTLFIKASTGDGSADGYLKLYCNDIAQGDPAKPYEDAFETYYSDDEWKTLTLGWWLGNYNDSDPPTAVLQFDDVYIDNSFQSVWIGDASTWADCTHREIQIPTAWADGEITIEVNQGSISNLLDGAHWLYVFDSNGNPNPNGCLLQTAGMLFEEKGYVAGYARDVHCDGTYVYVAGNATGIKAYTFDGSTFTFKDDDTTDTYYTDIWVDSSGYVYCANDGDGLRVFSFDGSTLTNKDNDDQGGYYHSVHGDGTHTYCGMHSAGLSAYTFDGTTLTHKKTVDPGTVVGVWCDNIGGTDYIFAAEHNKLYAYTFDGTNFTEVGSIAVTGDPKDVWSDGSYIYLACMNTYALRAYSFDGSNFTLKDTVTLSSNPLDVWGDGVYIYLATHDEGLYAFTFDGSSFTQISTVDPAGNGYGVMGDGTYVYNAVWYGGLYAYDTGVRAASHSLSATGSITIYDSGSLTIH
jgi:hypothetical protein